MQLRGKRGVSSIISKRQGLGLRLSDAFQWSLRLPFSLFIASFFLVPVVLGAVFSPIIWLGVVELEPLPTEMHNDVEECFASDFTMLVPSLIPQSRPCLQGDNLLYHSFVHAVCLATSFGGNPRLPPTGFVTFMSSMVTLVAQLCFCLLSGAVFLRLAQPSLPIKCATRAVVFKDTDVPDGEEETWSLVTRLVLTGPVGVELLDVKFSLLYYQLAEDKNNARMDLPLSEPAELSLVLSEIPYLRVGAMIRHAIDQSSPLYGKSEQELIDEDAIIVLTVIGTERSSMQMVFHAQPFSAHDGDIVWSQTFDEIVVLDPVGRQHMVDHAKLDLLRPINTAGQRGNDRADIMGQQYF
eukprot:jgi/Chlat1/4307/Chrsp29S04477